MQIVYAYYNLKLSITGSVLHMSTRPSVLYSLSLRETCHPSFTYNLLDIFFSASCKNKNKKKKKKHDPGEATSEHEVFRKCLPPTSAHALSKILPHRSVSVVTGKVLPFPWVYVIIVQLGGEYS